MSFAQTSEEIVNASNEFIGTLSEETKIEIIRDFSDSLRTKWTNLPIGLAQRPGVKFGDLTDISKIKFHKILTTLFSSKGYLKTTSIMQLDDILSSDIIREALSLEMINDKVADQLKNLDWNYNNYYITFWSVPSKTEPWGGKV